MDNEKMIQYEVNEEQYKALEISKNIAVRAGAGSGKTRVLTKRYIRLLKEVPDIDIKNIVAITFTEKAALEMKERIREMISEEISKEPKDIKKKRWKDIRDSITLANICTIHSFCSNLIRENFYCLGLDPYFKVIEEVDRESNLRRIADEALSWIFTSDQHKEEIYNFLKMYTSKVAKGRELSDSILSVYSKIREKGISLDEAGRLTSLSNKICYLDLIQEPYEKLVMERLNSVERLALNILEKIDAEYTKFKNENNVLDFNDLELLAYKILHEKNIRDSYRDIYKFILLDEAQDINTLQKKIIYKLAEDENGNIEPGRLFVVGDHKQSIYGFRGTDYTIFNQVCEDIGKMGEIRLLSNCYRSTANIIGTVNNVFCHLINPYEPLKVPDDGEVKQGKKIELILFNRPEEDNCQKAAWVNVKELIGKDDRREELKNALSDLERAEKSKTDDAADIQSRVVATRIRKLIHEGFNYKDIAILLRSRTNLPSLENSLKNLQIPYSILGGIGFWERQEVVDIINLYRFIINSGDFVALAGSLRSPIFSFDDGLLFKLFSLFEDKNENTVLQSLKQLKEECTGEEKERAERAFEILTRLKKMNGLFNASELLNAICDITCYKQILLTEINGFQKYRNIEKLINIAQEFDEKKLYKASEFVTYLEVFEDFSSNEEEALLDTEDSNAVKILTIHSSKGLEFKAVIIPDMSKEADWMAKRGKPLFVFSGEYGITAIYQDENRERSVERNPLYKLYYEKELNRELEDSKRIFYVAATRAKEFLAFIGEDQSYADKKGNIRLNSFMRQLKYAIDMNGGSVDSLEILDGNTIQTDNIQTEDINCKQCPPESEEYDSFFNMVVQPGEVDEVLLKRINGYQSHPSGMFSISGYIKYLDCPRRYFYEYKAKLKGENEIHGDNSEIHLLWDREEEETGPDISSAEKGTIVHKIFEEMLNANIEFERYIEAEEAENKTKNDSKIKGIIEGNVRKNFPYLQENLIHYYIKEVERYSSNYLEIENKLKKELSGRKIRTFTELEFGIPLTMDNRVLLRGFIDRLDIYYEDEYLDLHIIDYKTNKIRDSKDLDNKAEYYRPQMMLYTSAAGKLIRYPGKKIRSVNAYLYFLDCGEYRKIEFTQKNMKEMENELLDKTIKIFGSARLEDFECNKGERCNICVYKSICL